MAACSDTDRSLVGRRDRRGQPHAHTDPASLAHAGYRHLFALRRRLSPVARAVSNRVALCVAHAVSPKVQWLAERQVEAEWPVHGLFARLHLDNAKEFRSEALRRGCEQYGIAIDYRPVRTPHYGGHIERLIGTVMGKVHLLPGTTFSDVRAKGDLDPQKTASMTIEELERWLAHAITAGRCRIGTCPSSGDAAREADANRS